MLRNGDMRFGNCQRATMSALMKTGILITIIYILLVCNVIRIDKWVNAGVKKDKKESNQKWLLFFFLAKNLFF